VLWRCALRGLTSDELVVLSKRPPAGKIPDLAASCPSNLLGRLPRAEASLAASKKAIYLVTERLEIYLEAIRHRRMQELTMSAPPSTYQADLNRREEIAVSGAALSEAPWKLAGAAGVTVAGADMLAHLVFLHPELFSPLSEGVVAFFAVAGAGALVRTRHSRALRWARSRPWRFAVMPGAAAAIVIFVLTMLHGSGIFGSAFTALWHGAVAYGITGVVGSLVRPGSDKRS
jgi:hypothetical protein